MSAAWDRVGRFLCLVYLGAVGVPLFVLPGYRTTNWTLIFHADAAASLDPQPLRIHWCAGFAALVALYFVIRAVWRRRFDEVPRLGLVVCLGLVFLTALIAGLVTDPTPLRVVYFAQTILPMSGFLAGAMLADRVSRLRRVLLTLVSIVTLSIVGVLLVAYSFGALSTDVVAANRLARGIPQLQDYFPFVVVSSLSLAIGLFASFDDRRLRALLAASILVHLSFFAIVWSRMALVMLGIVVMWPVIMATRSAPRARSLVLVVTALLLLVGAGVILSQVTVLGARLQYSSDDDNSFVQSDANRIEYAIEALRMIVAEPLFGRRFGPDSDIKILGSRTEELRIARIFRAHNQYLDYGIRAGLPAMILLAAILWTGALDLRRALFNSAANPDMHPLVIGVAGALLAMAVGNVTQVFLVQAQTGALAWFLMGVTVMLPRLTGEGTASPC